MRVLLLRIIMVALIMAMLGGGCNAAGSCVGAHVKAAGAAVGGQTLNTVWGKLLRGLAMCRWMAMHAHKAMREKDGDAHAGQHNNRPSAQS